MKKLIILCLIVAGCRTTISDKPSIPLQGEPFAIVSFNINGCTSCAPCMSKIRKSFKGSAQTKYIYFGGEAFNLIRVTYQTSQKLPLLNMWQRITSSGLSINTIDVVLEASGVIKKVENNYYFVPTGTTQRLELKLSKTTFVVTDKPIRIKANVEGFEKNKLFLIPKNL